MIDKSKEAYQAYREAAQSRYRHRRFKGLRIPLHAAVQICEGGAFVEAEVFVPDRAVKHPVGSDQDGGR